MPVDAFSQTFARLRADRGRGAAWIMAAGLLVLAGWCAWATVAHFTLYEVSSAARVELDDATYPIQAPLAGEVIFADLRVGQAVHKGDVLIEIDPKPDQLQQRQQQTRAAGLAPEMASLRAQISAEEQARLEEQRLARLSADEAASRVSDAETTLQFVAEELARVEALQARGLVPARDLAKARVDVLQHQASLAALRTSAQKVGQEQTTRDRERDARIEGLRAAVASHDTEQRSLGAEADRLAYDIERRKVRAAVDGVIAEAATVRPGAVVGEGTRLGSIVPAGRLLVVAQFPAKAALGRIQPGQAATMRLDGFPWTEFGSVPATVARVAQEIRDGNVRVELAIDATSAFRGRLAHGMPGSIEVAVERLTPLALLLRLAGNAITAPR